MDACMLPASVLVRATPTPADFPVWSHTGFATGSKCETCNGARCWVLGWLGAGRWALGVGLREAGAH